MSDAKELSLQEFLDQLASKASTPGGGSVAAVMGAQAAALLSMVCNLTIGKPQYKEVEQEMAALLEQAEQLRAGMTAMIKDDITAFNNVISTYRMPKQTDEEKNIRNEHIQRALKEAAEVPLACARSSLKIMALCRVAAEKGNINVVSDAGVAVMAAYGALKSAAFNVYVNIGSIHDQAFVNNKRKELEKILTEANVLAEELYNLVKIKL